MPGSGLRDGAVHVRNRCCKAPLGGHQVKPGGYGLGWRCATAALVAAGTPGMIGLSVWPKKSRLIPRMKRPHPGAQLIFTDLDGHRVTAFLTDTLSRGDPAPSRRAGTATLPARPGRRPHPRRQVARPVQLAMLRLGRELCLAGGRAGRRRPYLLGQADLIRARAVAGPLRDRRLPLPCVARQG
jgi:hypothetical protein